MNNPSPLIPQGSLLEQKNKSRSRVKVAFSCVVGVHVAAILAALFAQGCKREPAPPPDLGQTGVPAFDTNLPPMDTTALTPTPEPPAPTLTPEPTPPEPTPAPAARDYVIKKGDTFSSIAPTFNVSVKALQTANPTVNPARLQIGQKIAIPEPTATTAPPSAPGLAPAASPGNGGDQIYVVKAGDTLTKIARDFNTTPTALRKANNLVTDRIKVGDKLKVTAKSAAATGAPPQ